MENISNGVKLLSDIEELQFPLPDQPHGTRTYRSYLYHKLIKSCIYRPSLSNMSHNVHDATSSRSCQDMLDNLFGLSGRTIILTGGARGIGLQLLKTLITAGADVACLDILPGPAPDKLKELKLHVGAESSWVHFYKCDITDEAAVEEALADIEQKATQQCRPIKGLVNCAGIQMAGEACELPVESFRQVIDVNVTGSFLIARQTAKILQRHGTGGSLLLMASMAAHAANRVSQEYFFQVS